MINLRRLLVLFFFLSGFCALTYQVVWQRQLALVFGTTAYATASVLAIFFCGLALGSFFFGRIIDQKENSLKLYAFLELGIGLYAFLTPLIFKFVERLQVLVGQNIGSSFYGFQFLTFLLSFLALILPTILMGGTLPVIAKFLLKDQEIGEGVSFLYFINTLGAVMGAFLAGFFLIAFLGVRETIWLAAGINLIIGITILVLCSKYQVSSEDRKIAGKRPNIVPDSLHTNYFLLGVFFLTGLAGLAMEVFWTRTLILFFGASIYAFATVLVSFLLGIAIGSLIFRQWGKKFSQIWLAVFLAILGTWIIFSIPLFEKIPFFLLEIIKTSYTSFGSILFWQFILSFFLMFLATLVMGLLLPLGIKFYQEEEKLVGWSVGSLYAANTLGGVFGSLLAGFFLIPRIGVQKGIWLMAAIYLFLAVWLIVKDKRSFPRILISFVILVILLIGYLWPLWNKHFLVSGPYANWRFFIQDSQEQAEKRMQGSDFLYYREGIEVTVAVKKLGAQVFLRIDGKTDASTGLDIDTQVLSGALPMILHPNPEDVLVVGLGSGITLGSVEQFPAKNIEAVEIEPAIIEANKYFSEVNHRAIEDQRLKVVTGDGRNYLLKGTEKYDVITSEPSNIWLSGNSKLFTKEYFELAKKRLNKGGIFAHWIQLYSLKTDDLKTEIKTFQSVFPYTTVWDNLSSYDLLLLGSQEPINLDADLISQKLEQKLIKNEFGRIFIESAEQFLSYLALGQEGIVKFIQGAKENTDNHPFLEFSAPKSLYQATTSKNIEAMKDLRPKTDNKYFLFRQHVTLGKMYFTRGETLRALEEYRLAYQIDKTNQWLNQQIGGN
ncbi:MAG: fused MFS/spermidine synthase [Patescibacteria group bacterium]|nr:fused MFS/spermidine synthase [Patescibacteria group bacterium]MCL5095694.1 fused MFS/spermidine synthase [Patescibacteria group bacterium]